MSSLHSAYPFISACVGELASTLLSAMDHILLYTRSRNLMLIESYSTGMVNFVKPLESHPALYI